MIKNLQDTLGILDFALLVIITRFFTVIEKNLVGNELSQDFLVKSVLLKLKVEIFNASVSWLIFSLVKLFKERVLKNFLST